VQASKNITGVMGVLGKSVSHDAPDVIDGLHGIIAQFTETAGQMTVVSDEPDAMGGQSDAGLSAQNLATHWQVDLNPVPPTPMTSFVRDCGELVTAWVVLKDDAENTTGGDGAKLAALRAAIAEKWSNFSQSMDQLTGPSGFICLNDALDDAGSVAIVKTSSEAAILCYTSENMAELHGKWSKSTL
jgi:hypothetical protein